MYCINELNALSAMSQKYGSDRKFVLAGGGNTSYKSDEVLFIKGSGTALATIKPEQFVKMDRALLAKMWETEYPANEAEREAAVLADMMDARLKGESGRPSVETLLHDLFPQRFVLHVHPAAINGITCSAKGKTAMKELFPDAWSEKALKDHFDNPFSVCFLCFSDGIPAVTVGAYIGMLNRFSGFLLCPVWRRAFLFCFFN